MAFNVGDKLKHKRSEKRVTVVGKTAQHYQLKGTGGGHGQHMRSKDVEENYEKVGD